MKTLIAGPKLAVLLDVVRRCRDVEGVGVELGVYQGGSLAAMAREAPDRQFYGFDTFEGLPAESWSKDEIHRPGEFADTRFESVRRRMPGNVTLIRGLFPQCAIDTGQIAVAHVDFDFYESTRAAIEWLLPRMAARGAIVFDDYEWRNCPGVKRAIDEAGLQVDTTHKYQAIHRV